MLRSIQIGFSCLQVIQIAAIIFVLTCSSAEQTTPAFPTKQPKPEIDHDFVDHSLEKLQIIGEGTDFLTIQLNLSAEQANTIGLTALVMDRSGRPVQYVTGYSHVPKGGNSKSIWFFFCVYAPQELPVHLRESHYIQFNYQVRTIGAVEKTIKVQKQWGVGDTARILDLPSPPDAIPGVLLLENYAFLAKGDPRQPKGYYVEGIIISHSGRWDSFVALSDIEGDEPKMDLNLETDRGWLELRNGKTHSMQEANSPIPPYVTGWWDGKGYFHPDPLRIYRSGENKK